MTDNLTAYARRALNHGLCVLPAAADGTKRPGLKTWKEYQQRRPAAGDIEAWFGSNHYDGLGYICGTVSGGLEMFEFEARAVDAGMYDQFLDDARNAGLDFVETIDLGYCELSPAGGIHWLYRVTGQPVDGNLKLARRPGEPVKVESGHYAHGLTVDVLIETRGEGGWTVAAPSGGRTHPTGQPWQLLHGAVDTIATITGDQRAELLNLARTYDKMPDVRQTEPVRQPVERTDSSEQRPGDVYNRTTTWAEILEPLGWVFLFDRNGIGYWRRPGKQHGISATTNALGTDRLKVFSSSTAFDTDGTYDKLGAVARLHHNGDISAAARHVAHQLGLTPPAPPALETIIGDTLTGPKGDAGDQAGDHETGETDSWQPVDLSPYLDGTLEPIRPTVGEIAGGEYLFYLERVSVVFGQSGDGKTWVAYAVAAQVLEKNEHVLWCDLEDSPQGTIERLKLLGVDDRAIRHRFHYLHPDEPLTAAGRAGIGRLIARHRPALAVIDSTGESVSLEGLNPDKDHEVAEWGRKFPRWIASRGPAVVLIDHVPKSRDRDPLFAIGTQRKRAMIDGAAYLAEMVVEFGRGRLGKTKLTTAKDRGGNHERKKPVAMFILDARETPYRFELQPVDDIDPAEAAEAKRRHERQAVHDYIDTHPDINRTDLRDAHRIIGLPKTVVLEAAEWLVDHEYVQAATGGRGNATRYSVLKTYDNALTEIMGEPEAA